MNIVCFQLLYLSNTYIFKYIIEYKTVIKNTIHMYKPTHFWKIFLTICSHNLLMYIFYNII